MSLLTVVTVVFNAKEDFLITLDSVRRQTVRGEFEYLVIDGGSTDGTVEAIRDAAARGEVDRWLSEPDQGIYDAMNKAVRLAAGEWILFLNTADVFVSPLTLEELRLDSVESDLAYGSCEQVYPDGGIHFTPSLPLDATWKTMPCSHQSLFARKEWLGRFPFDLRYRVAADHHFLARCLGSGASATRWDVAVARVRLERYTWRQLAEGQRQKRLAMIDAGGPSWVSGHYARQTLALAVKHLIKKVIPPSVGRRLRRS